MKISNIETFLVHPQRPGSGYIEDKNWLLVKAETDQGIVGWGEAYTMRDRDKNIALHIAELSRYIVGRSPFCIKHFTQMVYNDFAGRRGAIDLFCAMSGIEQAMWDIVGRALGSPVYNLLGGPCRDRIRVYANGWATNGSWDSAAFSREELAQRALKTVQMGFTALKFEPFRGPCRTHISRDDEISAVKNVQAVREAVGPDVDILIEVHRRLAPMHAIRVARMLEEFNPFWYEEPVPSENLDALAEVRRAIRLPVVTGETLCTKAAFRGVLERRAADIINPDVSHCGGILELKEIAAMAEPYYVAVCPHNHNSTTIALAATIQVAATMPNFLITEYFVNFADAGNTIALQPFGLEQGCIKLSAAPGLGVEINEEALREYSYRRSTPRTFPTYRDESP